MTKQCIEAMAYFYGQEKKTGSAIRKDIIDEALNQLLNWAESELDTKYLIRNAWSNAKKKVYRYNNRNIDLAEQEDFPSDSSEMKIVELGDVIRRANFTRQQEFVLLRNRQGYTVKEISLESGVALKSVYSIRQQVRMAVADELKKGA